MRPFFGTCGLLLLSATVLAQSGGAPSQRAAALAATQLAAVVGQNSQGCPANLTTSHLPGVNGMQARPAADGTPAGLHRPNDAYRAGFRVELLQTALQDRHIAQARITFHGRAGQALLPANQAPKGDVAESFTMASSPNDHQTLHSTVYTSKMLAVQWVELNEITYADGHTWTEPAAGQCRFEPNGFMLVAAQ